MTGTVIVPGNRDPEGFVELARTAKGRIFRKQILHMGESFVHPNDPKTKITVDEALATSLANNFHAGHCDTVQVPIVDGANHHTEDPLRNLGEVLDVEYDDKGVYAVIDARKPEQADQLGKTLLGASAMMSMDYVDTKTGDHVGPTLLHVAVTNRPYITNLSDFEEVVGLSADTLTEGEPALLKPADQEDEMPTKEEMIAALKDEHGIDVASLLEGAAGKKPTTDVDELKAALSGVLSEAGVIKLSAGEQEELTIKDIADAVIELSSEKVALSGQVQNLIEVAEAQRLEAATKEVEQLVREGRVLPKAKDTMVALAMDDRESFDSLVPDKPLVELSAAGVTTMDEPDSKRWDEETSRLLALSAKISGQSK